MRVTGLAELPAILAERRSPRSRSRPRPCASTAARRGGTQKVALPEGYLDDLDERRPPGVEAELAESGG